MVKLSRCVALAAAGISLAALAVPHQADAQPTAMCVRQASGVPGDSGTPKDWFPFGAPTATGGPDDPRWVGASGHSVAEFGPAVAPVELRTTWANPSAGVYYLYLSWQFFYTTSLADTAHVLQVVVVPPGGTIDDPGARVIRMRFRGGSTTAAATYCQDPFASASGCPDSTTSGVYTQYKRWVETLDDGAIVPLPSPEQCGEIVGGADFEAMPAAAGADTGVLPWLDSTLRYWNVDGRWTVQMRIPVMSSPRNLAEGIAEGTKIAYQASVEPTPGDYAFHRWPRDVRAEPARKELVCDRPLDFPSHEVVDPSQWVDDTSTFPALRDVHVMGGGPAAGDPTAAACGGGVSLDWLDIGALDSASNITSIFNTTPDGGGVVRNTLVARIQNNSPSDIADGAMTARFRIANWGSQVPQSEAWTDVPVVPYDTDAGGWPPAEAKNTGFSIPSGTTDRQIQLPWAMTPIQFCQYTHDFASSPNWTSKCEYCDGDAGPSGGVRPIGTTECGAVRGYHQCMAVELRGGNVDYDKRGVARNMDFASLSSDEQIATIDLAGMPTAPGQSHWDVFLIAMPRNVPAAVPAGTTGTSMVAANARTVIEAIRPAGGGHDDVPGSGSGSNTPDTPLRRDALAFDVGKLRKPLPPINGLPQPDQGGFDGYPRELRGTLAELERIARIDAGAQIKAEELTMGLTQSFTGSTVAQLVPTLDVYVYVRAKENGHALTPLTSFVLMGHHEGALTGMRAGVDWAERIVPPLPASASEPAGPRVYRLRVPAGQTVDVRPWMQALVDGETPRLDEPPRKPPGTNTDGGTKPEPCVEPPQGCCRCGKGKKCPPKTSWQLFGETVPFGIAAVIGGLRSRRRKNDADRDQRKK